MGSSVKSFLAKHKVLRFPQVIACVKLAQTPEEQRRGLMFMKSLGDIDGMLFEYRQPEECSFWMENTDLPLSIAFIDCLRPKVGMVIDIQHMEPYDLTSHRSPKPVIAALEVPQGWFEQHNVVIGDVVTW